MQSSQKEHVFFKIKSNVVDTNDLRLYLFLVVKGCIVNKWKDSLESSVTVCIFKHLPLRCVFIHEGKNLHKRLKSEGQFTTPFNNTPSLVNQRFSVWLIMLVHCSRTCLVCFIGFKRWHLCDAMRAFPLHQFGLLLFSRFICQFISMKDKLGFWPSEFVLLKGEVSLLGENFCYGIS